MEGEGARVAPSRARKSVAKRSGATEKTQGSTKGSAEKASKTTPVAKKTAKKSTSAKRTKMPLLVVANSPHKDAALAGLERWKARHPDAAKHLAVDDVLVDSMRGRSTTWTRIRINLRHVPEKLRPKQETPDPDDDPTRAWREARAKS
jgi:hypothetical protein